MKINLAFLIVFLQVWHFGMANPRAGVEELTKLNDSNQTVIMKPLAGRETNFPIQIGNKLYHVETESKLNWHEAAHKCRQLGGYLLNIESSQEMDELLHVVPANRYWTSANCLAKNREWISITTGEVMPYLRWHPMEPNSLLELCVEIGYKALNDLRCNIKLFYICEAKIIKTFVQYSHFVVL